jgi:hypothetical protein
MVCSHLSARHRCLSLETKDGKERRESDLERNTLETLKAPLRVDTKED